MNQDRARPKSVKAIYIREGLIERSIELRGLQQLWLMQSLYVQILQESVAEQESFEQIHRNFSLKENFKTGMVNALAAMLLQFQDDC
jgi:hypothetical protein